MGFRIEKDEDIVFNSLSQKEKLCYYEHLKKCGGNVEEALNATVGKKWFDKNGNPIRRKKW